jgi:hypothetical protein
MDQMDMGARTMTDKERHGAKMSGRENMAFEPYSRGGVLSEARDLTYGPRAESYGAVVPNHHGIARLWQAYLESVHEAKVGMPMNFNLTAEDVAMMMVLLKMQRTTMTPHEVKRDSYVDMTAYSAIAGECAYHVRNGEQDACENKDQEKLPFLK